MNQTTYSAQQLPIMEEFYSLQGEGFHTGEAAYFVRVGGCKIGCPFCDVKESWNDKNHPLTSVNEIIHRIKQSPTKNVILTGGEPMLYNLSYLCEKLQEQGVNRFLETSGSERLSGQWEWICVSPKRKAPVLPEFYPIANELKVIVEDPSDFDRAEEVAALMHNKTLLYLQAEWSKQEEITPLIIDYILHHPQWKISLQTHKFIHIR
ncbi:MAG: 7-carboxy-7-deazaguanine synthase QueE [Bacteroidales bacterium]